MMNMSIEEIMSLVTNAGFPAALCLILLRYILQTIGKRLDRLDGSVKKLTRIIQEAEAKEHVVRNERLNPKRL